MAKKKKRYVPLSVDHRDIIQVCPVCGYKMDTASGITDAKPPVARDLTVCLQCGEIGQFDADMKIIRPNPEDVLKVLLTPTGKIIMSGQDFIKRRRAEGNWTGQKP